MRPAAGLLTAGAADEIPSDNLETGAAPNARRKANARTVADEQFDSLEETLLLEAMDEWEEMRDPILKPILAAIHNAKTPEALCAEIISVTCDRVRECEPEIERSSCLKIGFSLCAEFTIDLSSTRAVYDICIPKILASSCHELRVKSPPECENLFKQNNPSDAGVNPSIRYPTLY